jgi:hypothetical protein
VNASTIPQPMLPFIIIALVFPFFFVALWVFVMLVLSTWGGWRELARRYATTAVPEGTMFDGLSGRVGMVNYNHVLTAHAGPRGLHLAPWRMFQPFHPPLLIPWNDIGNVRDAFSLLTPMKRFDIGSPAVATVSLPAKVLAAAPQDIL